MTAPTMTTINPFFYEVKSQFLLIKRYPIPAMTISDITPMSIKDIDIAIDFKCLNYTLQINMTITTIFAFICLLVASQSVQIPCQFNSQTWEPNNTYKLTERQMIVSTRYGFDMIVDALDESVSQTIKIKGFWDSAMIHLIAFFLKPGMKILNLGPQTGLEAIMMGKIIGKQGKMYIFEPYTPSFAIVKKNIYLNDIQDQTVLYKVGASDVQADQKILVYPQNTGGAQIFSKAGFPSKAADRVHFQQIVQVDLVDNVLPMNIELDFALIDVQKLEVQALLGMKRIIQRSQNLVIITQWSYLVNSHRNQQKTIRCLNWLTEQNYKFYYYKPDKKNACQIGQFEQVQDPLFLLKATPTDLVIVPSHIDPNQLK